MFTSFPWSSAVGLLFLALCVGSLRFRVVLFRVRLFRWECESAGAGVWSSHFDDFFRDRFVAGVFRDGFAHGVRNIMRRKEASREKERSGTDVANWEKIV